MFKAGALLGFEELGALLLPVDFVPVVAVDFRQEVVQLELLLMTAYHPIAMKVGYLQIPIPVLLILDHNSVYKKLSVQKYGE